MRGDEYVDVVIDVVFGDDDDDDDNDDNESSNVNFPSSKKKFFFNKRRKHVLYVSQVITHTLRPPDRVILVITLKYPAWLHCLESRA